jgi:hypothetical protein
MTRLSCLIPYEMGVGRCLKARAATPSGLSRFASSCQHRITIACVALAWFCLLYFAAQLVRGAL